MKVLLFGATGRTGRAVVRRAWQEGCTVTAFVRSPSTADFADVPVKIVEGNVLDAEAVAHAIAGHDVVISALQIRDRAQRSASIEHIITGMYASDVRRILAIGGSGCLQLDEHIRYHQSPTFPERFRETSLAHWEVYTRLEASDLDWTFVCPSEILEGDNIAGYITQATYRPEGSRITTAAVADFLLRETKQNLFIKQRVGICFPSSQTF